MGGLRYLENGIQLKDLKDGHYHFMIHEINRNKGMVYAIQNLGGEFSFNEARKNNYIIKVPIEELRKIWFGELRKTIAGFHIDISNNGEDVKYKQGMGRRMRMRKERAPVMAKLLAEEFGSVDGFMDENNSVIEPGSDEEQIYRQLKSGQTKYFNRIEAKLGE